MVTIFNGTIEHPLIIHWKNLQGAGYQESLYFILLFANAGLHVFDESSFANGDASLIVVKMKIIGEDIVVRCKVTGVETDVENEAITGFDGFIEGAGIGYLGEEVEAGDAEYAKKDVFHAYKVTGGGESDKKELTN